LSRGPGQGAVLVGHSMGGLVAHAALARGARAAGLITVGTPHAGSYGADAYFAAIAAARGCLVLCPSVAATLTGAAIVLRHRFGAALADLTRDRRTRTAPLGPPGVPLAAWAGAVNGQPVLPPGLPLAGRIRDDYLVPNDGIVGRGSATGALADLRPAAVVRDGAARHSSAVPPRSAPTELGAPAVAAWVVGAAEGFAAEPQAARLAAPRRSVPRSATVELQSLARLQPGGEAQPITDRAVVISTAPIGVLCDDVPAAPVEVTPGLWFLDLGAMGCRTVRRSGTPVKRAGAAIALGIDGGAVPVGERATAVRSSRGGWRLVVRLTAPGRPSVTRAGRAIRLRRLRGTTEWRAGRSWAALLPRPGVRSVAIRVGVEGPSPRVAALALP
jgi:pimeloyl-ACP methyl ester carboxylesterase